MDSKKMHKLSGAEALEEYFTSLLDEELEFDGEDSELVTEMVPQNSTSSIETKSANDEHQHLQLQQQPKLDDYDAQTELEYSELEVPDLNVVQKLLDKLGSTDVIEEPEIANLIEKNTATIAQIDTEQVEPEIASVEEEKTEEIQQWQTETESDSQKQSALVADNEIEQTTVNDHNTATDQFSVAEDSPLVEQTNSIDTGVEPQLQTDNQGLGFEDWTSTERDVDFQVLYFDVNGVTFAVPLDELGGIHKTAEMSHLIGRPSWYLGLQTNKDNQYDVVDTAKWVMADRLKDESHKEAYQYIVMLGNSSWGLAATELKGTELLNVDSVRWRSQAAKRPWLAGMVKEKMCALIHVEAMIKMITAGLDVKSLDSDKGLSKATQRG
ncbi:chemotaxis protein CheW [Vibrio sp. TH_r3]|uniref:chemotaxis protein CheW n=1 Tax=Vibrio sp. TH_r3 TaxID=3082084 RepID=UPI0029535137|nr:chemotaxis protein CheW [Vibrio sp. TH_r3]MDV7103198.1 chemotaxis protein CheW [Vibrio sp. TH_r3]